MAVPTALDDRLYRFQRTTLPGDLAALAHMADVAFLQGRDGEAERLTQRVEQACQERGITVWSGEGLGR